MTSLPPLGYAGAMALLTLWLSSVECRSEQRFSCYQHTYSFGLGTTSARLPELVSAASEELGADPFNLPTLDSRAVTAATIGGLVS